MLRLAKLLLVAALMTSIGAHWALLQGVAWLGMAVTYSVESGSVAQGLEMTFDGEHGCPMCRAVEEGIHDQQKQQDKSQKQDFNLQKLATVDPAGVSLSPPRPVRGLYLAVALHAMTRAGETATPPPRTALRA